MGEARNIKFGRLIPIDFGMSDKIPPKRAWSRLKCRVLNFKAPYLNLQRVKLQTSNLAYG